MKTLIVYYSLTGKTELVAGAIAERLDADVRQVQELNPRTNKVALYVFGGRAAMKDQCDEIIPCDHDVSGCDLVFIGTPNWANKPVPAINTFISKTDFRNKPVVLFCTMFGEKGSDKLFSNFTGKVEAKSGRVVGSFVIDIQNATNASLVTQAESAVEKLSAVIANNREASKLPVA